MAIGANGDYRRGLIVAAHIGIGDVVDDDAHPGPTGMPVVLSSPSPSAVTNNAAGAGINDVSGGSAAGPDVLVRIQLHRALFQNIFALGADVDDQILVTGIGVGNGILTVCILVQSDNAAGRDGDLGHAGARIVPDPP